ncbi:hypothetical protein NDI54_13970 [Haloarcula sp. S1AR25-5A]|uniref:DUF7979 domain-containing protein n=1 Tax=Haloarcula terrestris TaxID=2950533 RepID=A0AAE4EYD3_9EURY|nr:hypothetical protein [Haloarcula terrestris]MDS0222450.1 hypothetical protein [Haloarcula terrestris]
MNRRLVHSIFALLVAASLIGAPITMLDWGQQASFSVNPVEESDISENSPILQYERLPNSAQDPVRRAIESPDNYYTIYGQEDFPEPFNYGDNINPGQGQYVIVYEEQYYRLRTSASGGFFFVYLFYQLPFIIYGALLAVVAFLPSQGWTGTRTEALITVPGIVFHLLGPELDFPLLPPMQFVKLGVLAVIVVLIGLLWSYMREKNIIATD